MPTLVDKEKSVDLLGRAFDGLSGFTSALTPEQWELGTCLPGWSVHDVVGHVVGTELMLLGEQTPELDLSHLDHLRNPVAEVNELWVESMRTMPSSELQARLESVTSRRIAALKAMTQDDFDAPSWTPVGNDETYGRFMRIRHFDCTMHEEDIRAAVGAKSRLEPDSAQACLEEVETGLGYIVGRKAGLPDGSTVRIDLSGPGGTTYFVAVDGRAAVVPSLTGAPTVGLEMPVDLFLRLTGGRSDSLARIAAEVTETGDLELAHRLATHLAFTI